MKRTLLPIQLLFIFFIVFSPFIAMSQVQSGYKEAWDKADSLALEGLPRSALEVVEEIYSRARAEENAAMQVKAVIHRMLFQSYTEEESFAKIISGLQTDIRAAEFPVKQVLHSLLADTYWNYYQQNRYQLHQRSTVADTAVKDFKNWDYERLLTEVIRHYGLSLENPERQQETNVSILSGVLKGDTSSRFLRPSLYDFLAQRALDMYIREESSLAPRPSEEYLFEDPKLFSDAEAFARMPLKNADSLSLPARGLELFQELTQFHLHDQDASALVDLDLKRLAFIHRKSRLPHKDSLYTQVLRKIIEDHRDLPVSAETSYALANFYYNKSQLSVNIIYVNGQRRPVINDGKDHPLARTKAHEVCVKAIAQYPGSRGARNCQALLEKIEKQELDIKAEDVNIPGEPFRLLITYRNLPNVYLRVVKLWEVEADSVAMFARNRHQFQDRAENLLLSKSPLLQYTYPLPAVEDFNMHSAEIKIDALPAGNYAILASEHENFKADSAALSFTVVEVSGIGSFSRNRNPGQEQEVFVTNRKTGRPLAGVSALTYQRDFKDGKSLERLLNKKVRSDKTGRMLLDLPRKRQYRVLLVNEKDTLTAMQHLWVRERPNRSPLSGQQERTVFFTDRSIYRPGQTVHFKGLMLLSDEKTKIWPHKRTEVWFSDANGEEISTLELMSNEFGTFSGTFLIPETGLPGRMTIENDYGQVSIEVAEYKRPTFAVEFDAVGEIYQLNDSVRISGKAESFSGFSIDKAEVRYTVTRTGNLALYRGGHSYWSRYIYPPAEPLAITHGIAKTDEEGKFSLSFKAEASDTSQVYSYQVTAHITDMNGETRSGSTSVNVGNKNLLVTATIGPNISAEQDVLYQIGAKNLNGYAQESDISLKIYALKAPKQPLRERLWDAPDQFIMSREEFKRSFPHDIYADEDDFHNWERGKKRLELEFHTDSVETFDLAELGKYASGHYLAEIHATAASGETATQRYFFHFQQEEPGVPQTVSNYINVLKNEGESGESAAFLTGAGQQPSYILYEIISDGRISEQRWIKAGKNQQKILFPLDINLTPNLAVQLTMVHQNRIYRTMSPIVVKENDTDLEIEMLSFRDKLRPGEKETWTIKISAPGNEKAAAEMVATLYDASLDAILPHSWPSERIISPPGVTYYSFSWETGYFLSESRNIALREFKERITEGLNFRSYETLQLFGYSYYGGYNRSYRDYLRRIKEQKRFELELEAWEAAFQHQSESLTEGIVVSGTLKDESGNTLPGVSIQIEGDPQGLMSNSRGEYKIKVPAEGALVFTALGFKSKEVKVNGRKQINVVLESDHAALDEVVVVGYGGQKKRSLSGAVVETASNVMIRGSAAPPDKNKLREGPEAAGHPEAAANPEAGLQDIVPRKNFNETAFFYPQLRTDEDGKITIEFTMPESITRWKMLGFAHTKDLRFAGIEKELITSKEVSVSANAPRFLRAGDRFAFTAKVVNLTGEPLQGAARLELLDALTLQPVDSLLLSDASSQQFSMGAFSSKTLSWEMDVPEGLQAITYRVFASAGKHSDGEENTLPVLSNRILITETLPMQVGAGETRDFSINTFAGRKLPDARPYRLTLEYTANPAWYAVQALPYLMEYPYECAEQLFSRYFANSLATTIMNSSPRIKAIFTQWKNTDSDELLSELEKNQELKSALLEETPWVMQSKKDSERKRRLALLFDLNKMQQQNAAVMQKLSAMQLRDGSFPWFAGMRENRFITQHILAGIGQLQKLNALPSEPDGIEAMVKRALRFTDRELAEDYRKLIAREDFAPGKDETMSAFTVHYLYMRSFFPEIKPDTAALKAIDFYLHQAEEFWTGRPVYQQGMIALVLERNGKTDAAKKIINSLKERAQHSEDKGMYWTSNRRGYYWHEAPIETQALLIEAFAEVVGEEPGASSGKEVEEMKKWLLLNKQTNNWESTKATVAACYALLLRGTDWLEPAEQAGISLGGKNLEVLKPGLKQEAGTGYLKTSWEASEINEDMESIRISNPGEVVSWGALYWQYFAKPENVPASGEELEIHKTLYKETMTASGPLLVPLNEHEVLNPGDLVKVRMELKASRDYEYVHLKDLRAAAFEPLDILARYHYQDGLGYYQATKDASTNFFISYLPKGSYVLEYSLRVTHSGTFSNGFAQVQCMYAPEFSARSQGQRVSIK